MIQPKNKLISVDELKQLVEPDNFDLFSDEDGMFYTDFFSNYQTDVLISHLLVEQLFLAYDRVNWELTLNSYDPYILARINDLYLHPLTWINDKDSEESTYEIMGRKCAELYNEERADNDDWNAFIAQEAHEKRIINFAKILPALPCKMKSIFDMPVRIWPLFLGDYSHLLSLGLDNNDPYHINMPFYMFKKDTFKNSLDIVADDKELGRKRAIQIIHLLQDEWPIIAENKLLGYDKDDTDVQEFEVFLFNRMNAFIKQWYIKDSTVKKEAERHIDVHEAPIPKPNNYVEVWRYIVERRKYDEKFRLSIKNTTLVNLAKELSDIFQWIVDQNSLGHYMNRHHLSLDQL